MNYIKEIKRLAEENKLSFDKLIDGWEEFEDQTGLSYEEFLEYTVKYLRNGDDGTFYNYK